MGCSAATSNPHATGPLKRHFAATGIGWCESRQLLLQQQLQDAAMGNSEITHACWPPAAADASSRQNNYSKQPVHRDTYNGILIDRRATGCLVHSLKPVNQQLTSCRTGMFDLQRG
jgi:hypothetical protein